MPPASAEFDLRPDPRILPMLGEINLAQWRCVAELVDNSIDGFLTAMRAGSPTQVPAIIVNVPTSDTPNARVTIRDNGPGMSSEVLEKAVRAGWTGNSPIGNLGMFGMGFNIATARLGAVTTVWTTVAGSTVWHGLRIDFEELVRQRHFRTPHLTRAKADASEQGTEITIERLKPEQRAWLVKPGNQNQLRQHLGLAYASMLRPGGTPIHFALTVNGRRLQAKNHCVWNESRSVDLPRWGTVNAVINIDQRLPPRKYCLSCMQWLASGEDACPSCNTTTNVVERARHVHGWIGLQRYLSTSDFGFDFIRNGRKIEMGNKDLFDWRHDDEVEREYPIDDPRNRGRFVGEIHIDHCRVTYTKDRFDRTDPAWDDMVRIVRGEGPLRPEKANQLGYGGNESPLFKLFQAFRRSSPHNQKVAGGWQKVIVVKDNDRAEAMARDEFHKGTPEYQDDTKWWELVVEEDNRLLTPQPSPVVSPPPTSGGPAPIPGFGVPNPGSQPVSAPPPPAAVPAPPPRQPLPSLTQEYRHDGTSMRWDVRAFEVRGDDPILVGASWRLVRRSTGEEEFFVNPAHNVFRSATLTPLDALLAQLAWSAVDFTRGQINSPSFASVLTDLRDRYAGSLKLDPALLKAQADTLFAAIAKAWPRNIDPKDASALFADDLTSEARDAIITKMAIRGVTNHQEAIERGRFLEYATARVVAEFVVSRPELFFDGRCWDVAHGDIDFPIATATEEARRRVLQHYQGLLFDAVWLSELEVGDLQLAPRERVIRAALAIELLQPDVDLE